MVRVFLADRLCGWGGEHLGFLFGLWGVKGANPVSSFLRAFIGFFVERWVLFWLNVEVTRSGGVLGAGL